MSCRLMCDELQLNSMPVSVFAVLSWIVELKARLPPQ
jgi:hypothetical protein